MSPSSGSDAGDVGARDPAAPPDPGDAANRSCFIEVWPKIGVGRPVNGAGERNRTADLRITSALLYQLSYTSTESEPRIPRMAARQNDGATPQNRTGDTVIFSHVLYQLS